ncbi:hypothetical protein N428_03413, partial [Pseudomonas sp. RV120224-01c]
CELQDSDHWLKLSNFWGAVQSCGSGRAREEASTGDNYSAFFSAVFNSLIRWSIS